MKQKIEWLVGTDHDEMLLLRLSRFRSTEICNKLLTEKNETSEKKISPELINKKSIGLSSAIDSALNFYTVESKSLNTKLLLRYYALLQFTIAEEVASLNNESDLELIQKSTEFGHGLATYNKYVKGNNFTQNYYCYLLQSGHFYKYLEHLKVSNIKDFSFSSRIKKNSESISNNNLISLSELFRRIPELHTVIEEYIGEPPLTLNIGYNSTKNNGIREERRDKYTKETGSFAFEAPPVTDDEVITHISIIPSSINTNIDLLNKLCTPFSNFEIMEDKYDKHEFITCEFKHKNEGFWYHHLQTYKSSYCATTYIIPIFDQFNDPILINFMLLYSLSIIVRYLPDVWYKITLGELNHIGSLIEYYISIIDHVIPKMMLERITEKELYISMPGGFDSPV